MKGQVDASQVSDVDTPEAGWHPFGDDCHVEAVIDPVELVAKSLHKRPLAGTHKPLGDDNEEMIKVMVEGVLVQCQPVDRLTASDGALEHVLHVLGVTVLTERLLGPV